MSRVIDDPLVNAALDDLGKLHQLIIAPDH